MKEIKAVFFDIDGTYYDHVTNRVLTSTKETVKALQKQGYKVALCSGRPLLMAKELPVFGDIVWDGFIGGGGVTSYDENFQLIASDGFTNVELQQIFHIAKQAKIPIYACGNTTFMTEADEQSIAVLKEFHVQVPKEIRDYAECDTIEMMSIFKGYEYDYSAFLSIKGVCLQKSSGVIMDIVKEGMSKTKGIQHLMEYWNLSNHAYMAFGDSMNDASMLQEAKIGVVMENGDPAVFPYADYICGPSNEDSIQKTIKHFNLL